MNYKIIFVVGYWKSGTTLLQHLLARDKNIQNLFEFDGKEFWDLYFPWSERSSDKIPEILYRKKKLDINNHLDRIWDEKSKFILLKRPQFAINIDMLKEIFKNIYIIGIKRELVPNIYSMLRVRAENNYPYSSYFGLHPPGWHKFLKKPLIERLVWQYFYANNSMKISKIPIISYEELCDDTTKVLQFLENELDHELNIEIPKIKNLNYEYKTGRKIKSWNETTKKGILELSPEKEIIEFPPLKKNIIRRIEKCAEKYKNILLE